MNKSAGAVAIFVKTPGVSPVKTRLAASIGARDAERFYLAAVDAVSAVAAAVQQTYGIKPYWAVAEAGAMGHRLWAGFERVTQGEGGLGERMALVYNTLLGAHPFVLLIGADCIHLPPARLGEAAALLGRAHDAPAFALGRTSDGGFYLFGGTCPVPTEDWRAVPYSEPATAGRLSTAFTKYGRIAELPETFDVDTLDDLRRAATLPDDGLLPAQQRAVGLARRLSGRAALNGAGSPK